MISEETLYHKNPVTGEPQMISLGWMVRAGGGDGMLLAVSPLTPPSPR